MANPSPGRDHHPCTRHLCSPAKIEVFSHREDLRVVPADLCKEVGPHERAPAGRQEHIAHRVVLAVVNLAQLDPADDGTSLVDGHAHLEETTGVLPAHVLRGDHTGVRPEGLLDHDAQRLGVRRHVIVAEQEVRGPFDHLEHRVGACPETQVASQAPYVGAWRHYRHPVGEVFEAGVED